MSRQNTAYSTELLPLSGTRVLSLALNLPGPAALVRLGAMGATCIKAEPLAGDPMDLYAKAAYAAMHEGLTVLALNLKTEAGQQALHTELAQADVLITSFRPSALVKLGLSWPALHAQYPQLSMVAIVGAPGERADEPGHDLTYQADAGLVTGLDLPATLFADMGGALMASEAVLKSVLLSKRRGQGVFFEVALSEASGFLALPRAWGLTTPEGTVGGAHAGYRVYPCQDGRVALAALEPHFAAPLCLAAGVALTDMRVMFEPATRHTLAAFFLTQTRQALDKLAAEKDIPLHTLPP